MPRFAFRQIRLGVPTGVIPHPVEANRGSRGGDASPKRSVIVTPSILIPPTEKEPSVGHISVPLYLFFLQPLTVKSLSCLRSLLFLDFDCNLPITYRDYHGGHSFQYCRVTIVDNHDSQSLSHSPGLYPVYTMSSSLIYHWLLLLSTMIRFFP